MSEKTEIAWTDSTFNPWWGCTKVSPACANCYASALDKRTGGQHWGAGVERRRTGQKNWNEPKRWNRKADAFMAEHGRRQRVFCASMADVFDNEVPEHWRLDLFRLIRDTPNIDWLLLTKRISNANIMLANVRMLASEYIDPFPWPNIWVGATISNQAEANRDIQKLLAVPSAKRFLSIEPLLGPIDLTGLLDGIDWVIVGGESGPNARPMHPDWPRLLRDQCQTAGVSFLFKQWGEWAPLENFGAEGGDILKSKVRYVKNDGRLPYGRYEVGDKSVVSVGKKVAGRLLDGIAYHEFP